ncbi:MAG: acyl carrier protein [Clostridia bacterium]|nr:acyl carrier protein [Clostridia bacterium]
MIMFEKVKKLLVEELSVDEGAITPEAELVNDLGINSLELADLVLQCEEKFDIEISDEEIHKFITVGDVANYLAEISGESK